METTYAPKIGDSVFLHSISNDKAGNFYHIIDINDQTMALQAAKISGDHLEETDNLDVVILSFNKKTKQ